MKDTCPYRLYAVVFAIAYSTAPSYGAIYLPPTCPLKGLHLYPNDICWLYYHCDNGVLTVMSCNIGERFDRIFHRCRLSFLVDCDQVPIITPPPKTTAIPPTIPTTASTEPTTIYWTENTPTVLPQTVPPTYACPPTGHVSYPTEDCTSFYNCNDGVLTTEKCPVGTTFDPSQSACVQFLSSSCIPGLPTHPPPVTTVSSDSRSSLSFCLPFR